MLTHKAQCLVLIAMVAFVSFGPRNASAQFMVNDDGSAGCPTIGRPWAAPLPTTADKTVVDKLLPLFANVTGDVHEKFANNPPGPVDFKHPWPPSPNSQQAYIEIFPLNGSFSYSGISFTKFLLISGNGQPNAGFIASPVTFGDLTIPKDSEIQFDQMGGLQVFRLANGARVGQYEIGKGDWTCVSSNKIANVRVAKQTEINATTFPPGSWLMFDQNDRLSGFKVPQIIEYRGFHVAASAAADLYSDGSLHQFVPSQKETIRNKEIAAGEQVGLWQSGDLQYGQLSGPGAINGVPCDSGSTDVAESGYVLSCTLAADYQPTPDSSILHKGSAFTNVAEESKTMTLLSPDDLKQTMNIVTPLLGAYLDDFIKKQANQSVFGSISKVDRSTSLYSLAPEQVAFRFEWHVENMVKNVPPFSDCDCDCGINIGGWWEEAHQLNRLVFYTNALQSGDINIHCPHCPLHEVAAVFTQMADPFYTIVAQQDLKTINLDPYLEKLNATLSTFGLDVHAESISNLMVVDGALVVTVKYTRRLH